MLGFIYMFNLQANLNPHVKAIHMFILCQFIFIYMVSINMDNKSAVLLWLLAHSLTSPENIHFHKYLGKLLNFNIE